MAKKYFCKCNLAIHFRIMVFNIIELEKTRSKFTKKEMC